MFSAFWAFQIFAAKLGFIAGAMVLPFQLVMLVSAMATLAVLILPKSGRDLVELFKHHPAIFWRLFLANTLQAGLGTCLSIIGIALTDAINAGFLVKMATVTTILFAWLILKENLSRMKIAIMLVMLFGAYLLTTKGQSLLPQSWRSFYSGSLCLLVVGECAGAESFEDANGSGRRGNHAKTHGKSACIPDACGGIHLFPPTFGKLKQCFEVLYIFSGNHPLCDRKRYLSGISLDLSLPNASPRYSFVHDTYVNGDTNHCECACDGISA